MSAKHGLPPGVSQGLYDALPKSTLYFDGEGQVGNWSDPANWWGGTVPTATSLALVPLSTTMDGSFTAQTLMFLGTETVTVNGVITTTNTNLCESFMVCDGAVAVFDPGSALNAAGALIVGNEDGATLIASGTASLTSLVGKIGRLDHGAGTVTIDGAHWTNTDGLYIGQAGSGTVNVLDGGQVAVGAELAIGFDAGSTGQLDLSSGGTVTVGSTLNLGSNASGTLSQSVASVSIGASSLLSVTGGVSIFPDESITLAGGTLAVGVNAPALRIGAGATLSGFGTVTASSAGIADRGTIIASGGTLVLNGNIGGTGTLQITAGSTAEINAAQIAAGVAIDFTGQGGMLELSGGIKEFGTISGFAAGNKIAIPGIDSVAWNGTTGMLTLSDQGHQIEKLHVAGSYPSHPFTLSESSGLAIITA